MALRAKDELLREGRKRGFSLFYAGRRSSDRKTEETEEYVGTMDCHTESVKIRDLQWRKCVNCILSYLVMFILENIQRWNDVLFISIPHWYYMPLSLPPQWFFKPPPWVSGTSLGYTIALSPVLWGEGGRLYFPDIWSEKLKNEKRKYMSLLK